ncbi:MAG: hypothetical protein K2I69_06230 [Muribaculaceae bacterium]|nr:hypothetical protein [Muribaculaceae bacterium]
MPEESNQNIKTTFETPLIPVTISTDKYNVISNGVLIIPNKEPTTMQISGLKFTFRFENDNARGNDIDAHPHKDEQGDIDYFEIVIYNSDTSSITSYDAPFVVASINDKDLGLMFSLMTLSGDTYKHKILYYTWLLKK